MDNNTLRHFGILGMKWGVRRYQNKDGTLTSAGKTRKSSSKKSGEVGNNMEALMAVSVTALAFTAATVSKIRSGQNYIDKQIAKTINKNKDKEVKNWSDLPKIEKKYSINEDTKSINPNFSKRHGYNQNCSNCAASYELRRRGYDVEAKPLTTGVTFEHIRNQYIDRTEQSLKNLTANDVLEKAAQWGEGARGSIIVAFDKRPNPSGHIFSIEVQNGKANFVDPQTGKVNDSLNINMINNNSSNEGVFFRTDNVKLSDSILDTCYKKKGNNL